MKCQKCEQLMKQLAVTDRIIERQHDEIRRLKSLLINTDVLMKLLEEQIKKIENFDLS